mmetsp:Transcript_30452/g.98139  ORF Transcript_30452/g.98139 Transcript_30452/m.98139 type:complete len:380 (-) Transcript_30452:1064-2203(-)
MSLMEKKAEDQRTLHREQLQKYYMQTMALGFYLSYFQNFMRNWMIVKAQLLIKKQAVITIEKYYFNYVSRQYRKRKKAALMQLTMILKNCIRRFRHRFRAKKINIILTFLGQVGKFARFQMAVKRFRAKIIKAQGFFRRQIACNIARYEILELQWNKIDDERKQKFLERREAHLSSIKKKVDPGLDLKGKAKGDFDARLKWVEAQAGIKKLRECKAELDSARRSYCEYFLPSDLVRFESISPLVKKRMLELYVKKIRQRYNHEWNEYRKKLSAWIELQKTQESIKSVSRDLVSSLGRSGSQYLTASLESMSSRIVKPMPPTPNIVLPRHLMEQIILKAVEHTRKIAGISKNVEPRHKTTSHSARTSHSSRSWNKSGGMN